LPLAYADDLALILNDVWQQLLSIMEILGKCRVALGLCLHSFNVFWPPFCLPKRTSMRSSVGYALISAAAQGGIMRGIWELRSVEARSSISGTTSCAVFSPEQLRPRGRQWHDGSALHVQGVRDEPDFLFRAQFRCVGSDMVCFFPRGNHAVWTRYARGHQKAQFRGGLSCPAMADRGVLPIGPRWPDARANVFYTLATGPGVSLSRACLILSHACRHDMPIRSNVVRLEAERVGVRARQTLAPSPPSGRIRNFA